MLESLPELLSPFNTLVRVKWLGASEPSDWDWPLFSPVGGYLETGRLGPVSVREIEWIEVQAIENRHIGRLVRDQKIDHTEQLSKTLTDAGFQFIFANSIFHVTVG